MIGLDRDVDSFMKRIIRARALLRGAAHLRGEKRQVHRKGGKIFMQTFYVGREPPLREEKLGESNGHTSSVFIEEGMQLISKWYTKDFDRAMEIATRARKSSQEKGKSIEEMKRLKKDLLFMDVGLRRDGRAALGISDGDPLDRVEYFLDQYKSIQSMDDTTTKEMEGKRKGLRRGKDDLQSELWDAEDLLDDLRKKSRREGVSSEEEQRTLELKVSQLTPRLLYYQEEIRKIDRLLPRDKDSFDKFRKTVEDYLSVRSELDKQTDEYARLEAKEMQYRMDLAGLLDHDSMLSELSKQAGLPEEDAKALAGVTQLGNSIENRYTNAEVRDYLESGYKLFGKALITPDGKTPIKLVGYEDSGAHMDPAGYINIGNPEYTDGDASDSMAHEMAHFIEVSHPDLLASNLRWVKERGEKAFMNPYSAREYKKQNATEVISTGVEYLRRSDSAVDLFIQDPEHLFLTIGQITKASWRSK